MLRNYAVLVVLISVLFACRKEKSIENPNEIPITEQQWSFNAAGSSYNGPMDSAYLRALGIGNSLSMSGTSADGKGIISLQVISPGAIIKGDYKNPQVLFVYSEGSKVLYQSSSDETDDFTITIVSIDSLSVTGTFSGVAIDSQGVKQTLSEGKFTAVLAGAAPSTNPGQLTVWSKQLCGGTDNILVKVGDEGGAITKAFDAQPSCGATGAVAFTLPAGTYSVVAYCGPDSLVSEINILPGACTTLEVDFSALANMDYFPLQSRWTYGNVTDPNNDTLTIESSGDTAIDGTSYTKFYNDKTGETKFYRKENGVYYQKILTVKGQTLDPAPEIIILQNPFPSNTTWESPTYQYYTIAGISHLLTVKLVSSITNAGFSQTYNGRTYNSLIEVSTQLWIQNPDGNFVYGDSEYKTVFARGVGIVYYEDLDNSKSYTIRNFSVTY